MIMSPDNVSNDPAIVKNSEKNAIKIVFIPLILILLTSSCFFYYWFAVGHPAAVAEGTIVKIDDGTADYGLIGTVVYERDAGSYEGKFRLAKGHKYNSAMYEGQTVSIENSDIGPYSEADWETILYDYVDQ